MSRIGKKSIPVEGDVEVSVKGQEVKVKGKLGELVWVLPETLSVQVENNQVQVHRKDETKSTRAMHGTARSLIANMIEGVSKGFKKELEIEGVGYRAQLQGNELTMSLGYSHPVNYAAPDGVTFKVTDNTKIEVSGIDKQKVGLASARIRAFCKAEPYKGKGIRYKGERIRRKEGKTVA